MKVFRNYSLQQYNTFGLDIEAKQFVSIENEDDLIQALQQVYASEILILGGGSNMLLTENLEKTVLHVNLKGKKIIRETENEVFVEVCAGENWHEFVLWCIQHNYGGIENLALIPGNVGTSPIQNIGAYGVELKDTFVECEAIHIQSLEHRVFTKAECEFGYRNSIFKNKVKGQYIITKVTFALTKNKHKLKTSYGAILSKLDEKNIANPTIKDVAEAVISIRQEKLPNPAELGNSGSFFKNPIISKDLFSAIQEKFPEIPSYKIDEDSIKIPAGWLIEETGYKGFRKGDAGVHKKQALVLVNYGNATGEEILALAEEIQHAVKEKFGISLETEVNIIS
ncbi:UDP-N-acetylmuramate dehydrogenase [Mesonia maritima]|uniref:UDP-N-acetylenolpyruvoylglucosamine reductase n=1 Tax=Mesonia maritima TaxID=1793873 RepID=A0ABU1K9E2_9FLAO|nr:UDP-N-acetylmuramate dehydrogenase [Mesonia maritima]MDR6302227.1 UDP-N-acetylmuramate dehydrogenase [Mesonia maritima]